MKKYIILFVLASAILFVAFIFFRYFFTFEQRNRFSRTIDTVTGQNLVITLYDMNGRIIRTYSGVQKITSGETDRNYVFFYTRDNKYVQIPDSVWYVAEEQ